MKKKFSKFIIFWLPVLVWGTVIFAFSSRPSTPTSQIFWEDFILKKMAHVTIFGIFCSLVYRALKKSLSKQKYMEYLSIALTFLYGVTDEIHQSFVPGRDSTLRDMLIDTFGGVLAMYLILRILPKTPEKIKNLARRFDFM